MPQVSILLPTKNGERFLFKAIDSVRAQSFRDWELLIINDGSTDGTAEVLDSYLKKDPRVRVLTNEASLGIQRALNGGLAQARGEYIARIDDDDVWIDKQKLEKQVSYLTRHASCVLVGTGLVVVDESGAELFRFLNPETDEAIREKILYRNPFSHSTVMFRRSSALKLRGYSEEVATLHVEDYEFWLRLGATGKLYNLPDYSVAFMVRPGAISTVNKKNQLKLQLWIGKQFKDVYPGYFVARIKGLLRYFAYAIFAPLVPERFRRFVFRLYKSF